MSRRTLVTLIFSSCMLLACSRTQLDASRKDDNLANKLTNQNFSPPTLRSSTLYSKEIVLGQTASLSGRLSTIGIEFARGALAAIEEENKRGGIHGRKLRLLQLDDKADPNQSYKNAELLIKHGVIAFLGLTEPDSVKQIHSLASVSGIPIIAPRSGSESIRSQLYGGIYHVKPGHQIEAQGLSDYLYRSGYIRVAMVSSNDLLGTELRNLTTNALRDKGINVVSNNIIDKWSISKVISHIKKSRPNALVIATDTGSAARIIREVRSQRLDTAIMTFSSIGGKALQSMLPDGQAIGIGITQVLPFPWDDRQQIVRSYQQAMQNLSPESRLGYLSLDGYIGTRVLIEALKRTGPEITRENLVEELNKIKSLKIDGHTIYINGNARKHHSPVEFTFLGASPWTP